MTAEITRRFFKIKTDSQLHSILLENAKILKEVDNQIADFSKKHGASDHEFLIDSATGRLIGLKFEDGKADKNLFKQLQSGAWIPKKNSKEAKAIFEEMESLPVRDDVPVITEKELGLRFNMPELFHGSKVYRCTAFGWFKPDANQNLHVFVSVPYAEVCPQELSDFRQGKPFNTEEESYRKKELFNWLVKLENTLDQFSGQLVEMKKWQVDKEFEELREAAKNE